MQGICTMEKPNASKNSAKNEEEEEEGKLKGVSSSKNQPHLKDSKSTLVCYLMRKK